MKINRQLKEGDMSKFLNKFKWFVLGIFIAYELEIMYGLIRGA